MTAIRALIITAIHTGHGHKSLSDSMWDALVERGVEVDTVDGFALMGSAAIGVAKMYGPMTRRVKGEFWRLAYATTETYSGAYREMIEEFLAPKLYRVIRKSTPDVILTVHCGFNGSVINILERFGIDIPVCTLIADLVNIHPLWVDKRAALIFCPTEESYRFALRQGADEGRLVRCILPVRTRFLEDARNVPAHVEYRAGQALRVLLMSGGEGSGNMARIAEIILKAFNAHVTVVCGRNEKLHEALSEALEPYDERAEVLGFVTDVEKVMADSDLILLRGSPNTLMEAVTMAVPAIITGALPGQELSNPEWAERNGLAVYCPNLINLRHVIKELIADDGAKLNAIRAGQLAFRDLDAAGTIADRVMSVARSIPADVNHSRPSFLGGKAERTIHRIRTRGALITRSARRLGKRNPHGDV